MSVIAALLIWINGVLILPAVIADYEAQAPNYSSHVGNEYEWEEFRADAYEEYELMFTELFNSYETKKAKNGAMMIRSGNSGSFKFAKKGN